MSFLEKFNSFSQLERGKKSTLSHKKKQEFGEDTEKFKKALDKAQYFYKNFKSAEDIPDNQIPSNFTVTDIEGFDFSA